MSRHVKGADSLEDVKKVLVYYLERLEREEENSKISWVFDCKNAGLKNMELELINFIIFCMEQNYPDILNFIYIYEMPWIMNAAFKVKVVIESYQTWQDWAVLNFKNIWPFRIDLYQLKIFSTFPGCKGRSASREEFHISSSRSLHLRQCFFKILSSKKSL